MLSYPRWFSQVPEITVTVEECDRPYFYRADIERLLGLSARHAYNVLRGWTKEPIRNGLPARISKDALLIILHGLKDDPEVREAVANRDRVIQTVEAARQRVSQKKLLVKTPHSMRSTMLNSLPAGVELEAPSEGAPGCLTIQFKHFPDFMDKLGYILHAVQNDYSEFETMCGGDPEAANMYLTV